MCHALMSMSMSMSMCHVPCVTQPRALRPAEACRLAGLSVVSTAPSSLALARRSLGASAMESSTSSGKHQSSYEHPIVLLLAAAAAAAATAADADSTAEAPCSSLTAASRAAVVESGPCCCAALLATPLGMAPKCAAVADPAACLACTLAFDPYAKPLASRPLVGLVKT